MNENYDPMEMQNERPQQPAEQSTEHAAEQPTEQPAWQPAQQPVWQRPENVSYTYMPRQEPYAYAPPTAAPKKKKKRTWLKVTALILCCTLLSGLAGIGGAYWMGSRIQDQVGAEFAAMKEREEEEAAQKGETTIQVGHRDLEAVTIQPIDTSKLKTAAEVYAENVNSTVGITTSTAVNYWGYQTMTAASGSGFILSEDGYILTNHHVISGSDSITVTMYNGTSYEAELIGYDASFDMALLKVDAEGLVPVVLGDSDTLNVGDSVVAIGNPLGELTFSLTAGAVSALDREVTLSTGSSAVTMDLIQTDCAINSGNSGGALFNLYGEVIGITNAKYSSSSVGEASIDNIGFAIPINDVTGIVRSIIENGYIAKPYIGVSVIDVSEETQSYGLPKGAAVKEVVEDSPAEKAGLQLNDIVTKVNDIEITSSNDLVDVIGACSVGDELTLTVYRMGKQLQLDLVVGEKIQSAIEEETTEEEPIQQLPEGTIPWIPGFGG